MAPTAEITFRSLTERLLPHVEAALDRYSQLRDGCPAELREAIRYSLLAPGKRLRPMLVLLAAEACGKRGIRDWGFGIREEEGIRDWGFGIGKKEEERNKPKSSSSMLIPNPQSPIPSSPIPNPQSPIPSSLAAACAVEMVHSYSLIHDDLPAMDDDDLRRGRPTCHKRFGEAMAILAGDALLALAFEIVAKNVQPPATAAACCAELAAAAGACQLVGGQVDDVRAESRVESRETREVAVSAPTRQATPPAAPGGLNSSSNSRLSTLDSQLSTLTSIHCRKTGALILASLRLGAMVAGAEPDQIDALDRYGRCLGLAFQITDDLLDVDGDEVAAGKRLGKDSGRGKLTFPAILGVDASRRRAEELIEEAREAIAPLISDANDTAAGLDAVARYVLERTR